MYDQVKEACNKFSDYIAYEYMGKKVKYKKYIKQIDRTSIALKKIGVKKGDIVNICLPNFPEA